MGRIAKIISVKIEDSKIICTCEYAYGHNVQAELYLPPNEDSVPLPDDYTILVNVEGTGNYIACGILTSSSNTEKGEKKIFSRNAAGTIKATIYLNKNGKLTIDTDSDIDINSDGKIIIDGTGIELNGNTKKFVTYTELNQALQNFIIALNAHTHSGVQAGDGVTGNPTAMTIDISASETSTLKTGG